MFHHQRRQYVMKGGASGRDPAGERARQLVGEVAHRLPGKVLEQVKPQVDEPATMSGTRASPRAATAALSIAIRPMNRTNADKTASRLPPPCDRVDQEAHAVLDRYCAQGRTDGQDEDGAVGGAPSHKVVPDIG